tara:strand:+ start:1875 stop:2048 length:174 start_codon:yes stop_codon:yes gene_type:complete
MKFTKKTLNGFHTLNSKSKVDNRGEFVCILCQKECSNLGPDTKIVQINNSIREPLKI